MAQHGTTRVRVDLLFLIKGRRARLDIPPYVHTIYDFNAHAVSSFDDQEKSYYETPDGRTDPPRPWRFVDAHRTEEHAGRTCQVWSSPDHAAAGMTLEVCTPSNVAPGPIICLDGLPLTWDGRLALACKAERRGTTYSWEVVRLVPRPITEETFAVPHGYRKVEPPGRAVPSAE